MAPQNPLKPISGMAPVRERLAFAADKFEQHPRIVVVDIEEENESQVKGMIPTGWYPTSVAVTRDGFATFAGLVDVMRELGKYWVVIVELPEHS